MKLLCCSKGQGSDRTQAEPLVWFRGR